MGRRHRTRLILAEFDPKFGRDGKDEAQLAWNTAYVEIKKKKRARLSQFAEGKTFSGRRKIKGKKPIMVHSSTV